VLPICQVLLAVGLVCAAIFQDRVQRAETQLRATAAIPQAGDLSFLPETSCYAPIPLTAQAVFAIDFPVLLTFSPLILLGVKSAVYYLGLSLVGVFIFWWWVGRWIDLRPKQMIQHRPARIAVDYIGLLASIGLAAYTLHYHWGQSELAHLGILLWCLFGIVIFAKMLWTSRIIPS
jgi:hypothetical protein